MNKPQEAIENFRACINCKETINRAYTHISEGWIFFLQEKHDLAEKEFELAIAADPTCSYAYFSRGYVQDVLKKLDDAIESFNYALKFVPRYSPCGIYNNQAWCYEQKKDHVQDTLRYYTLAIESNPSFVRAYYNRSKVYQEENKFDEAITDLEQILQINRTHLYTYLELGDIYWFDKNNKEKALFYYNYAKNIITPTNVYAYLLIASIYAYDKDFEAANSELNLGMERCYQSDFLQELQKKKVNYDENYIEYLEKEAPNKYDAKTLRKIEEIKYRLDRDKYILNNKFYENKYRAKMKLRLKAILYIPLSELEIAATPLTFKPNDSMFELSPTRLSPMRTPVDFNYYIYYHYEHWNVGSVLFSDVIIKTRR
jgi:tetratricopeptide (TPR) repeat protein